MRKLCFASGSYGLLLAAATFCSLACLSVSINIENYALFRPTSQSSTFTDPFLGDGPSDLAVDGLDNPSWWSEWTASTRPNHQSCTEYETKPWWEVDMLVDVYVQEVRIINSCCVGDNVGSILADFDVFISPEPFNSSFDPTNPPSNVFQESIGATQQVFTVRPLPGFVGRFVRVQLQGDGYLTIPELEVYGYGLNHAYNKTATQSSTDTNVTLGSGLPEYAVDGNANPLWFEVNATTPHQSRTLEESLPYWEVDFGYLVDISRIRITNNCCPGDPSFVGPQLDNFFVVISVDPFTSGDLATELNRTEISYIEVSGSAEDVFDLEAPCGLNGMQNEVLGRGQFMRIQINGTGRLTLPEVEVFGTEVRDPTHRWGWEVEVVDGISMNCTADLLTAIDTIDQSHNATLLGGAECDLTRTGSIDLDGVDDYMRVEPFEFGKQFTVSVLYYPHDLSTGTQAIFSKKQSDDFFETRSFSLVQTPAGDLQVRVYSEYDVFIGRQATGVLAGKSNSFHRVIVTFDGRTRSSIPSRNDTAVKIYVNETRVDDADFESSTPYMFRRFGDYLVNTNIGAQHDGSDNFLNAELYEAKVYDYVISCQHVYEQRKIDQEFIAKISQIAIYVNPFDECAPGSLVDRVCLNNILSTPIPLTNLGYLTLAGDPDNSLFSFEHNQAFSIFTYFQRALLCQFEETLISATEVSTPDRVGWFVSLYNGDRIRFVLRASKNSLDYLEVQALVTDAVKVTGEWHSILVTYDGSGTAEGVTMYLDPLTTPTALNTTIVRNTLSGTLTTIADTNVTFGARDSVQDTFTGYLTQVRLYDFAIDTVVLDSELPFFTPNPTGQFQYSVISHWRFDEQFGDTVAVDYVGGNDGTLVGSGAFSTGKLNNAFRNDGVSYIEVPENPAITSFSFTVWIRWTGGSLVNVHDRWAVFSNYDGSTNDKLHYGLLLDSTTKSGLGLTPYFFYDDGSEWDKVFGTRDDLDSGEWYHLAGTLEAGVRARIYVNAELEATDSTSVPTSINPTGTMFIGRDGGAERRSRFMGDIDELIFYDTFISMDQIQCDLDFANQSQGVLEIPNSVHLQSHYPFDGDVHPNIMDHGPLGNNATLTPDISFNHTQPGQKGNGLCFDGNGFAQLDQNPAYSEFTVAVWLRWDGGAVNDVSTDRWAVISNYAGGGTNQHWGILLSATKPGPGLNMYFFADDGIEWQAESGNVLDMDNGEWRHAVVGFNAQLNMYIFLDGTLDTQRQILVPQALTPTGQLYLGRDGTAERRKRFIGCIDELVIWDDFINAFVAFDIYNFFFLTKDGGASAAGTAVAASGQSGTTQHSVTDINTYLQTVYASSMQMPEYVDEEIGENPDEVLSDEKKLELREAHDGAAAAVAASGATDAAEFLDDGESTDAAVGDGGNSDADAGDKKDTTFSTGFGSGSKRRRLFEFNDEKVNAVEYAFASKRSALEKARESLHSAGGRTILSDDRARAYIAGSKLLDGEHSDLLVSALRSMPSWSVETVVRLDADESPAGGCLLALMPYFRICLRPSESAEAMQLSIESVDQSIHVVGGRSGEISTERLAKWTRVGAVFTRDVSGTYSVALLVDDLHVRVEQPIADVLVTMISSTRDNALVVPGNGFVVSDVQFHAGHRSELQLLRTVVAKPTTPQVPVLSMDFADETAPVIRMHIGGKTYELPVGGAKSAQVTLDSFSSFSGVDDTFAVSGPSMTDLELSDSSEYTVGIWFRPERQSGAGNAFRTLFSLGGLSVELISHQEQLRVRSVNGDCESVSSGVALKMGDWTHLALRSDGLGFVNGGRTGVVKMPMCGQSADDTSAMVLGQGFSGEIASLTIQQGLASSLEVVTSIQGGVDAMPSYVVAPTLSCNLRQKTDSGVQCQSNLPGSLWLRS